MTEPNQAAKAREAVTAREPTLLQAFLPLVFLFALLGTSVYLFADNSAYGGSQISLLLAGGVAAIIAILGALLDVQGRNVLDLADAYQARSDRAGALLAGGDKASR